MHELKILQPDENLWPKVSAVIDAAFLAPKPQGKGERDHLRPANRRFALMADEQVVGGCISYEFQLTLPGGALVPAAGLAGVGILPTDQGKGGLSLLINAHLNNCRQQGDAVSVLMASESGLYSRFGYGPATEWVVYTLDTRAFALKSPVSDAGRIDLITDELEARALCAEVHAAQSLPGELQRSAGWWEQVIHQKERSWLGGGEQFVAVHRDADGKAAAYALYVFEEIELEQTVWNGNQSSRLVLRELVTLNAPLQAIMFQYLCKIAWVRELRWELAPVDPSIKRLMTDPRQLSPISRFDMLWMRVLQMPRLLMERDYHEDAQIEFNYLDAQFPELSGSFRLITTADREKPNLVEPIDSDETERLSLNAEQLASIVLGGTRVITLYTLGQITGPEAEARLLDRLLLTDVAPFNLSKF